MALVDVTDHAAERYLQRVRGALDARAEVTARVGEAIAAGRTEPGQRGALLVRDVKQPSLVYVCMHDKPRDRMVVVTLLRQGDRDPRR